MASIEITYDQARILYSASTFVLQARYSDEYTSQAVACRELVSVLRNYILNAYTTKKQYFNLDNKFVKIASKVMTLISNKNDLQKNLWLMLMFAAHVKYVGNDEL